MSEPGKLHWQQKTKALVCWSHFPCNRNYLLELSAYRNRVGNTLSWVINAVYCLHFIQNCIFKIFSCLEKKMVIIRTDTEYGLLFLNDFLLLNLLIYDHL